MAAVCLPWILPFLPNEYRLTRTARAEATQPPSGIGPERVTGQAEARLPPGGLDRLKVKRTGDARTGLPDVVAKALADRRGNILVPLNRAGFEGKVVPTSFLLDFAVALDRVKRLDGSKIFHGEFLGLQKPEWPLPLGDEKDGRRSDLAPRTVDCDW